MSEEERHSITTRLERALYDSGQQPLVNERFDRDIKRLQRDAKAIEPRIRAQEVAEQQRVTPEKVRELFAEGFKADLQERKQLATLVKLIYIPLGLLAAAALIDGLKGIFIHAR